MLEDLYRRLGLTLCFNKSDDDGHDDDGDPKPKSKTKTEDDDPPPGYFSRDYVRELRAENKGYRLKYSETEQKLRDAEKAKEIAEAALTKAQDEANKSANQRVIKAELKALAHKEGMIDLDGLSFIDYTSISFDDKGELKGGAEALAKLKEAKPYLFGKPSTTNTTGAPNPKSSNDPVNARELSADEYKALKQKMGIRV